MALGRAHLDTSILNRRSWMSNTFHLPLLLNSILSLAAEVQWLSLSTWYWLHLYWVDRAFDAINQTQSVSTHNHPDDSTLLGSSIANCAWSEAYQAIYIFQPLFSSSLVLPFPPFPLSRHLAGLVAGITFGLFAVHEIKRSSLGAGRDDVLLIQQLKWQRVTAAGHVSMQCA